MKTPLLLRRNYSDGEYSCKAKLMLLLVLRSRITAIILVFIVACCFSRIYAEEAVIKPPEEKVRLITISEGIGIVLKDSRILKVSIFDRDIASQDSFIARSALLPQINASVNENFLNHQPASNLGSQSVKTSGKQSLSYGFDVYQTLFDFGKSLSDYKASMELVNVSKANVEAVRKLAVLEFIAGYFDVLEAEKMIMVAEKEVESLTAYLNDIGHLYEQGAAIKNDLLPARVKLADAKQKLIAARNARAILNARLNNILAMPLQEKTRVQDIDMETPHIPGMEDSWKTAQSQRPEIKVINDRIKASSLNEKARMVENYPKLFADSGYTYTQNKFQVHQDNLFLNLGAKANLFDGGATKATLLKERFRQKQLLEQKDKLIEDIKFEIENSYFALKDATEKTLVSKEALAQAEENVRVNRIKYSEGSVTPTDVLEAITLQTNAQTNYYNADYEVKRSYAKLMYSMGIDLALIYDTMKRGEDEPKRQ